MVIDIIFHLNVSPKVQMWLKLELLRPFAKSMQQLLFQIDSSGSCGHFDDSHK